MLKLISFIVIVLSLCFCGEYYGIVIVYLLNHSLVMVVDIA